MPQKYKIEGFIEFKDRITKGLQDVSEGLVQTGEDLKQMGYEATRTSEVLDALEMGLENLAIFAGIPLVMALEEAREYNDELAKSFAVLSANSKVVINEIGNMLVPMFRWLAGVATRASKAFLNMSDELKTVVKYVMMFAVSTVAIAGVMSVIMRISRAVSMLKGAFMMLRGEMLKVLATQAPMIAVFAIILGFLAAYVANVGKVREGTKMVVGAFEDFGHAMKVGMAGVAGFVGSLFGQLEASIMGFWTNLKETVSMIGSTIGIVGLRVARILATIKDAFARNISFADAKASITADMAAIRGAFADFGSSFSAIGDNFKSIPEVVTEAWEEGTRLAAAAADEYVASGRRSGDALDSMNVQLDKIVAEAKTLWKELGKPFDENAFWTELMESNPELKAMLQKMAEFDDRLKGLLGTEIGITTFVEGWKSGFREMAKEMTDWSNLGKKVVQDLANSINTVLGDFFFSALRGRFEEMEDVFRSFGESLLRVLSDVLARIVLVKTILAPLIRAYPELAPYFNVANPNKGAQAGINTVPVTGLYELHRGERVLTHGDHAPAGAPVVLNMTVKAWDAQDVWRNRAQLGAAMGAEIRSNSPLRQAVRGA